VVSPLRRLLALAALASLAPLALAATGLTVLRAPEGTGPITVFYPTDAVPARVQRGPFTVQAAMNGAPVRGNGRLIVMSHGSGGSPWPQADLAQTLVQAGFTVAMPEHAGDNWRQPESAGPVSWKRRPKEVIQAIDAMAADPRFAPLLDWQRVGVYGMSAGGLTALTLAGARWSPAQFARHCDAHIARDFHACVGLRDELTGGAADATTIAAARQLVATHFAGDTAWQRAHDPRIAAIVAAVPVAAPIDMAWLTAPRVPLGLVRAGRDAWLAPRWHIDAVRKACKPCVLVADMPTAGHGSVLSPTPPELPPRAARLLNDPPGFDRDMLPGTYAAITRFFIQNLAP
jgi:predicted dienelactone hydrolase